MNLNLNPPPPPGLPQLLAEGDTRYLRRGPIAFREVLLRASAQMDFEDAYQCWLRGEPVPMMRHPRRKLRQLLFGRARPGA
jgi:hypothetical protein